MNNLIIKQRISICYKVLSLCAITLMLFISGACTIKEIYAEEDAVELNLDNGTIVIKPDGYLQDGIFYEFTGAYTIKGSLTCDTPLSFSNTTDSSVEYNVIFDNVHILGYTWCSAITFDSKTTSDITLNIKNLGTSEVRAYGGPSFQTFDESKAKVTINIIEDEGSSLYLGPQISQRGYENIQVYSTNIDCKINGQTISNTESYKSGTYKTDGPSKETEYKNINVKYNEETLSFKTTSTDTVKDLKLLIKAQKGFELGKQRLTYDDKELDDNKLLWDYNVTDGSVIYLTIKEDIPVSSYATKEDLMTAFKTDDDGNASKVGKIILGKNSQGQAQEWYVIGSDSGVNGGENNAAIFAASSFIVGEPYDYSGTKIYKNSSIRSLLQKVEISTNYFTVTEQSLLQPTTIKTDNYTTSDKLYISMGSDSAKVLIGSNDDIVLNFDPYWSNGTNAFWSRRPYPNYSNHVYAFHPYEGQSYHIRNVNKYLDTRPASNIDLTNVLFASSAKANGQGTIASNSAMMLRLDGSNKGIGSITYNNGSIIADKGNTNGDVYLIAQGSNWYYSKQINDLESISFDSIKQALGLEFDISKDDCKFWLETTIDNVEYAIQETTNIDKVELTYNMPKGGEQLSSSVTYNTVGVSNISLKWTDSKGNIVEGIAEYNPSTYVANITITPNSAYSFNRNTKIVVNNEIIEDKTFNDDGSITLTKQYSSTNHKLSSITAPNCQTSFKNFYTKETVINDNNELVKSVKAIVDDKETDLDIIWSIDKYDETQGIANIFKWEIKDGNYYDGSCAKTGTVTINNKKLIPVTITPINETITYDGSSIDVSKYFKIDDKAGEATYSLTSGDGNLYGTTLTINNTGKFIIRVDTKETDDYTSGHAEATLTIEDGDIKYEAKDYSGIYDGLEHSINISVKEPNDTTVSYSLDNKEYSDKLPTYIDAGEYEIYFKIEKQNYKTIKGSSKVIIAKKDLTITTLDQSITYGEQIDNSKYIVEGLANNDKVTNIKLIPSTTNPIDKGTIGVDDIVIDEGNNNYNISYVYGALEIKYGNTVHKVLEGNNPSWAHGSNIDLSIRANGDFNKFAYIKIDGKIVDNKYYTVKEGSTIIALKANYLNTLSINKHSLEIRWFDGLVNTNIDITSEEGLKSDSKTTTQGPNLTCEEYMKSNNWTWSEVKKACVYRVSNTNTK